MENGRKKYPIGAEHYTLIEEVGTGGSASVHRALCNSLNEVVAIKILDLERANCNLTNVSCEAQTMALVDHPNVLKSHCSFISDHNLWVVMPYMAGGSCLHIMKAAHPDGFEEVVIATILREVLKGLDYLHQHGHIHRDVKAGNVLVESRGGIKLGDFGVSACLFDSGDRHNTRRTFVGTPCWMAPEVMEQLHDYDFKADIWSFGITALELSHGHAPFSKLSPMKVLLMTLLHEPPGLDYEREKKFSKSFKQMIASCLVKNPSKRPSSKKLLKHPFFKQARSNDYIGRVLLKGLPELGDRVQAIKRKEDDMLAHKQMPDGQKEELSQNEYKRGISGWNFNLDDVKAQASLDDDIISDQNEDMQTKSLQQQLSKTSNILQHQSSFAGQYSDVADSVDNYTPVSVSSMDYTTYISRCEKSNDAVSNGSTLEQPTMNTSHGNENHRESNLAEKLAIDVKTKLSDGGPASSNHCDKAQNHSHNESRGGQTNLQSLQTQLDTSKGPKASGNGDKIDEKAKNQLVQQKGQFKFTSESVEMEKVITQLPELSPQLPSDASPSNPYSHALFSHLQNVLLTNTLQRDTILSAMNQIAVGDFPGSMPVNIAIAEKSMLDAAHEREKELIREITELQSRLERSQEEIQKYKKENHR